MYSRHWLVWSQATLARLHDEIQEQHREAYLWCDECCQKECKTKKLQKKSWEFALLERDTNHDPGVLFEALVSKTEFSTVKRKEIHKGINIVYSTLFLPWRVFCHFLSRKNLGSPGEKRRDERRPGADRECRYGGEGSGGDDSLGESNGINSVMWKPHPIHIQIFFRSARICKGKVL